ncbi:hypothetical protein [Puniceibacterium sediminis]|uniref:Ca-activated chloride channel family protein n=1 Tax=Puniceibacterium sediminis TaxID=1608407 RepID=A0A238YXT1_9RHOB|nr:hypothetical protein [Puniceibacterium sediminis]SNR75915.1 Ca-activated chloride channel family protein [Puniceibacterium sediminis]
MKHRKTALLALAVVMAVGAGPEAWAKLFMRVGAPALALPLLTDDATRGAALYELGRYAEADSAFEAVGRSATFDRGLTLAMTGDYPLSVAYFDAYLFSNRFDEGAQRSRAAVARLIVPVVGEAMGHGRIRAVLNASGLTTEAFDPENPELTLMSSERNAARRSIKRGVDNERTLSAGDDWLDALADAPGAYLQSRLEAEMERRRVNGTAAQQEADRW